MDKVEALDGFTFRKQPSATGKKIIVEALKDVDWGIREAALYRSVMIADSIAPALEKLIKSDSSSLLRVQLLMILHSVCLVRRWKYLPIMLRKKCLR
jgi:hypothetical protein